MKFQLNKLMAGLVLAGSVLALVGCGGGDAPTLGASSNVTATVTAGNTTAINTAKAVVAATGETGANFMLPASVVFNSRVGGGSVPAIPANSTLNLNPTTVPGAIADFKMTAAGTTKVVEGVVKPGSCQFEVTGPTDSALILDGYVVGQTYTISPCSFTIPTANAAIDTTVTVTPTLTLGTDTIPASRTISVTVNNNGSVTALVTTTVGGVTTTTPVPLAPAGSVSITTGGA